jgi:hypothetical protein
MNIFYWFFLICISFSSILHSTERTFDHFVSDEMDLVLYFKSTQPLGDESSEHPLITLANSPSVKEFLASLKKSNNSEDSTDFYEEVEDRFGLSKAELLELFPGQFLFGAESLLLDSIPDSDERPAFVILAEFSGSEARLKELMDIQFEYNANLQKEVNPNMEHTMIESDYMGVTIHYDEAYNGVTTYIEDGYALVDGVLVLASDEIQMEEAIERIRTNLDNSLAQKEPYYRSFNSDDREDFRLFLNFKNLFRPLIEFYTRGEVPVSLARFGITAESLIKATGIDSLDTLSLGIELVPDGVKLNAALLYDKKVGFLRLLSYGDGNLPNVDSIPDDAYASSLSAFDFSEFFASLEDMFRQASPGFMQIYNLQLLNLESQLGVNLKNTLLQNFGDSAYSYSLLRPGAGDNTDAQISSEVIIVEIKDTALFSQGLDAVTAVIPNLKNLAKTEDYNGQVIKTYRSPTDQSGAEAWNYALTRSKLVVTTGPVQTMKDALDHLETSPNNRLWLRPDVEALLDRVVTQDGRVVSRTFCDLSELCASIVDELQVLDATGALPKTMNFNLLENIKAPFVFLSQTVEQDDGIFTRALIVEKEAP